MAKTLIPLYRQGNANSPRMDNVRPNKDIATYDDNDRVWVMTTLADGRSPGGISTFATQGVGKNWWILEPDTEIPQELKLVKDRDNHWLWQPSSTMPMDQYKSALRQIGASFHKVS